MSNNETLFKLEMIRSQDGDQTSYHKLLEGLRLFLKNYLRKKIFNESEIEEVIQEILLSVHKSKHTYDSTKSFMSWFLAITEYKVIDYIRGLEKNKKIIDIENMTQLIDILNSKTELKLDFEKALNRLSSKERIILTLLKSEGQSVQDVALEMNLTESNVKVIAHRAFNNLRRNLGNDYENI